MRPNAYAYFFPDHYTHVIWLPGTLQIIREQNVGQSDTVQLMCCRHRFKRVTLDERDRETQTRGNRTYSPFICNLLRTVLADIVLPMDAGTTVITRVKVALRFHLTTITM